MTTQKLLVSTITDNNLQMCNAVAGKVEGDDRIGVVFTLQYALALERSLRQVQPSLVSLAKFQAVNVLAAQLNIEPAEWQGEDSFINVPAPEPKQEGVAIEPAEKIESVEE